MQVESETMEMERLCISSLDYQIAIILPFEPKTSLFRTSSPPQASFVSVASPVCWHACPKAVVVVVASCLIGLIFYFYIYNLLYL